MNSGKQQISARQFMFSIACYIQGSALISTFLTDVTKQETWIAVIGGYLVSLMILGLYTLLYNQYPGKSLVEINICVFGSLFGRMISLLYVYFFFSLAFLNTRIMGDFMNGYIMPKTPMIVILIMFIFVCTWAARKGVETMTRYSVLIVIMTYLVTLAIDILLIKDMKLSNLLPVFSLPIPKYLQSIHTVSVVSCCEILAFFMLIPHVKGTRKIIPAFYTGLSIGTFTILVVTLRNTVVWGSLISVLANPTFEASRLINIGNTLTRMEILYASFLILLMFFRVTILLYATTSGIAQIFNLHSYRNFVPCVSVLVIMFSLFAFSSAVEHAYWGTHFAAIYSTLFEVMLPIFTIITMLLKKLCK